MILLRSPGSVGSYFQRALAKRGISCGSGGGCDLLQTQEVETLVALLQVVNNPRQDIPLVSVLASPLFLFTAEDLARLRSGSGRWNGQKDWKSCWKRFSFAPAWRLCMRPWRKGRSAGNG